MLTHFDVQPPHTLEKRALRAPMLYDARFNGAESETSCKRFEIEAKVEYRTIV